MLFLIFKIILLLIVTKIISVFYSAVMWKRRRMVMSVVIKTEQEKELKYEVLEAVLGNEFQVAGAEYW